MSSTATEVARWTAVAASVYLGVTAYICPCERIYSCHAAPSVAALALLGAVVVLGVL